MRERERGGGVCVDYGCCCLCMHVMFCRGWMAQWSASESGFSERVKVGLDNE